MMAASTPTMDSKRFQELVEESTFNHGSFADLYTCGVCDMKMWADNIHEHLQSHVSVCTNYQFNNQTKTILPVFDNGTPTSETVGQKRKLPTPSTVVKHKILVKSPRKQTLYGGNSYSDAVTDERERRANMEVESYLNSSTDRLSFLLDNLQHVDNEPTYFAARPYPTAPTRQEQPTKVTPKKNKVAKKPKSNSKPKTVSFFPETSAVEFTATTLSSTTLSTTTLSSSILMKSEPLNIGDTLTKIDLPYVVEGKELGTYHCTVVVESFTPKVKPKTKPHALPARDKHGKFLKKSDIDLLASNSADDDNDDDYDDYMDMDENESHTSPHNSGELQDAVNSITSGAKPTVKTRIIPGGKKKKKNVKMRTEEKQGKEKVDGVKKRRRRRPNPNKPLTPHRSLTALRVSIRECSWIDEHMSVLIVSELKKVMKYVAIALPEVRVYFESVVEIEEFDICKWAFKDLGPEPEKVDVGTDPINFSKAEHQKEIQENLSGLSEAVKRKLKIGYTRYMQITNPEPKKFPEPNKKTGNMSANQASLAAEDSMPVSPEKVIRPKKPKKPSRNDKNLNDVVTVDRHTWKKEVEQKSNTMLYTNPSPKYGTLTIGKYDPVTNKFDVRIDVDPSVKSEIQSQQIADKNPQAPAPGLISLPVNVPATPFGLLPTQSVATSPLFYARPLNINSNIVTTVTQKDSTNVSESTHIKDNLETPCKKSGIKDKSEKVHKAALSQTQPNDYKVKDVKKDGIPDFITPLVKVNNVRTETPVMIDSDDALDDFAEITEMTNDTSGENEEIDKYEIEESDMCVTVTMNPPAANLPKNTKGEVKASGLQKLAGEKQNATAKKLKGKVNKEQRYLQKTPDKHKLLDQQKKEGGEQEIVTKGRLVEKEDGTVEVRERVDEFSEKVKTATSSALSKLNVQKGVQRNIIVYVKKTKTDASPGQTPTTSVTCYLPKTSVGSYTAPTIVTSPNVVSSSSVPSISSHVLTAPTSADAIRFSAPMNLQQPHVQMPGQITNQLQPTGSLMKSQGLFMYNNTLYRHCIVPVNPQTNPVGGTVPRFPQPQQPVTSNTVQQVPTAISAQQHANAKSAQPVRKGSTAKPLGKATTAQQSASVNSTQQQVKTPAPAAKSTDVSTATTNEENTAVNDKNKSDEANIVSDKSSAGAAEKTSCLTSDDAKETPAEGENQSTQGKGSEIKQENVDTLETKKDAKEDVEEDIGLNFDSDLPEQSDPETDSKANVKDKIEVKFECRICQLFFKSQGDFQDHNTQNHTFQEIIQFSLEKFQEFVCAGCGRTDPQLKTLALHKKYCNSACRCGFHEFDLTSFYNNYRKRQNRKKNLIGSNKDRIIVKKRPPNPSKPPRPVKKCPYCDFESSSTFANARHAGICKNRPILQCDLCSYEVAGEDKLGEHKYKVHRVKSVVCPVCQKAMKNQRSLDIHMRCHDPDFIENVINKRTYTSTICELCGKLLKNKNQYKVHIEKLHTLQKSCLYCGMMFLLGAQCQGHECVHTGDFRFSCCTCRNVFSSCIKYLQHMARIHNIKNEDSMLLNSMLRQTRALIYTNICSLCPEKESFKEESLYLKHMSIRHSMDEETAKQARLKTLVQERTALYHRRIELRHVIEVGQNAIVPVFPYSGAPTTEVTPEVKPQTEVTGEGNTEDKTLTIDTTDARTSTDGTIDDGELIKHKPEVKILDIKTMTAIAPVTAKASTNVNNSESEIITTVLKEDKPEVKLLDNAIASVIAQEYPNVNNVESEMDHGTAMEVSVAESDVTEVVTQI